MRIIIRGTYRRCVRRRATALLVCIFVMAITTVIVVSMVDTQTIRMTALRNTQQYEQALYLAGAAVHHAMAQVEDDPGLTTPFSIGPVEFPTGSGDNYQADVVDASGDLVITGSGTSGDVTRYLQVTITQASP
jgi:hypothetical protein